MPNMDTSKVSFPDVSNRRASGKGSRRIAGDDHALYIKNAPREWSVRTMPCGHNKIKYLKVVNGKGFCTKCGRSDE